MVVSNLTHWIQKTVCLYCLSIYISQPSIASNLSYPPGIFWASLYYNLLNTMLSTITIKQKPISCTQLNILPMLSFSFYPDILLISNCTLNQIKTKYPTWRVFNTTYLLYRSQCICWQSEFIKLTFPCFLCVKKLQTKCFVGHIYPIYDWLCHIQLQANRERKISLFTT